MPDIDAVAVQLQVYVAQGNKRGEMMLRSLIFDNFETLNCAVKYFVMLYIAPFMLFSQFIVMEAPPAVT